MFLWRSLKSSTVAAAAEALARGRAPTLPGKVEPNVESGQAAAKDAAAPSLPDR